MASRTVRRRLLCVAAFASLCAAVCALHSFPPFADAGSHRHPEASGVRQGAKPVETFEVRLAGRTISVSATNAAAFASAAFPHAVSRRGTAPFVLVANVRVNGAVRRRAAACGARVSGAIPPFGLVVEAGPSALKRLCADGTFLAAVAMTAEDKISPSLKREMLESVVTRTAITVIPLLPEDVGGIAASLASMGGVTHEVSMEGRGAIRAAIPVENVGKLAERGDVRWIERHERPVLLNDVVVRPGLMNVTPVRDIQGLTGAGQTITVSDTGLDTGNAETVMADFSGRVAFIGTVAGCLGYDFVGHGTHVAGSLAGNGALSGGAFRGVACGASLNVWQCSDASRDIYLPETELLFQPDRAGSPSYIHSASWGGKNFSEYDSYCVSIDGWMWEHPENLAVFAAGNDGGNRKIYSPAGAKNVIAVGATESFRKDKGHSADNPSSVATFSSKGPMLDGRIKPDLCAPGTFVLSTRSTKTSSQGDGLYDDNPSYMFDSGTSMATPLVAGSAALVRQWLMERRGYTNELPTAALIKAILMGGAHDMSGDEDPRCGGAAPNSTQGWGRVDLGESLFPTNASVVLVDRIPFSDGETFRVKIATTSAAPLSVQLVWTDYPGEYGAAQSLVNDLDLAVSNETTGAVWHGNGVEGGDRTNSVESVRIGLAEAGEYSVLVSGASVPYDCMEGGAAALFIRGMITEDGAEPDDGTVLLTVEAEDGVSAWIQPSIGRHRVTRGVPIMLSAEDALTDDGAGSVTMRRHAAGWVGGGDVPHSGVGGRMMVRLSQDSNVKWRWNDYTNVPVRSYAMIPSIGSEDQYLFYEEAWLRLGSVLNFRVPESVPGGSESFDMSAEGVEYTDEDGVRKRMTTQRLGRIEVAATGSSDTMPMTNGCGHMATEFSLRIVDGTDILCYFYDVMSTNAATTLPTWWYQRYVAQDPDADSVRFTSVSPQFLEWTGGAGLNRIVERTATLGGGADWQPVYTNAPAPALTNRWNIPAIYSTNSFYRIRMEQ